MSEQDSKRQRASRNRAFLKRVKDSFSGKISERLCLQVLCDRAQIYSDPLRVDITRAQLCAETGLCLRTVKQSLSSLRASGVIHATAALEGGRSRPVTYGFRVAGEPVSAEPLGDELSDQWAAALPLLRQINRNALEQWFREMWLHDVENRVATVAHVKAFHVDYVNRDDKLKGQLVQALNVTVPGGVADVRLIRAARPDHR